nr:uncharacterized protein CTRU02_10221 [Colletotrichum truncatum]KAF6787425.1 hypothetical protein CTRU02_10221 [Colletotrichum truncatum]
MPILYLASYLESPSGAKCAARTDEEDLIPARRENTGVDQGKEESAPVGSSYKNGTQRISTRSVKVASKDGTIRKRDLERLSGVSTRFGGQAEGPPYGPVQQGGP